MNGNFDANGRAGDRQVCEFNVTDFRSVCQLQLSRAKLLRLCSGSGGSAEVSTAFLSSPQQNKLRFLLILSTLEVCSISKGLFLCVCVSDYFLPFARYPLDFLQLALEDAA